MVPVMVEKELGIAFWYHTSSDEVWSIGISWVDPN